jgi:hypothetical protein
MSERASADAGPCFDVEKKLSKYYFLDSKYRIESRVKT